MTKEIVAKQIDAPRFWSKVDKTNSCWNWTASIKHSGHGQFSVKYGDKWIMSPAHRISYALFHGVAPADSKVLHDCDNPRCVNPNHLRLGSQLDNVKDRVARDRNATGNNHGRTKIKEEELRDVFTLYWLGVPVVQIGRLFGVDFSPVKNILAGKRS